MNLSRRFLLPVVSLIIPVGVAAGLGLAPIADEAVVVDGSSTVFRISKVAQFEARSKLGSSLKVELGNHGTGGGFSRYIQGEVDVIDASRDARAEETAQAKAKGLPWTRFLVGYDGITLVVHKQNTWVKALTTDQLKRLFSLDGKAKTWKDLDPTWPDRKIVLFSPDPDSGTFEFFVEAVIKAKEKQHHSGVQVSPDDTVLVNGVANEPDSLGYFGYAYYVANKARLRAVPIDGGKGPVAPDLETILNKTYAPLSRPLYIFVKNAAMKRPEVAKFVGFYLDNVADLTKRAGYVPPTASDIAANKKALAGLGAL